MPEPELRDSYGNFLANNGVKYPNIVVLDADLSASTRTNKFAEKYPNRFFNMGVAEQNMLGVAIGFAISGKVVFTSGFSVFTTGRAWEFIRMVCHDNLNVKIVVTHSGLVGEDGSSHNALEDLSLMATLPNLTVLAPADNNELIQMLESAVNVKGPFYIRLPRGSFPNVHEMNYKFVIGKPNVLKEGKDVCLIGFGYCSSFALHSAQEIEKQSRISLKVINLSSIKPIDTKELIKEIKDVKGLVVLEEHNIYCGVGSIVARIVSENFPLPMRFIGINNSFGESGTREAVLNHYGFNLENILKQIKTVLSQG